MARSQRLKFTKPKFNEESNRLTRVSVDKSQLHPFGQGGMSETTKAKKHKIDPVSNISGCLDEPDNDLEFILQHSHTVDKGK